MPDLPPARRSRRRSRRLRLLVPATAAVVLAAGGAAWALTRASGPSYRVASVQYAAVDQSVTAVGTVSAVDEAAVSFPVPGQVATVPVTLGQQVRPGQVLATLATVSLQQQLTQADQTLADDRQRLADDQSGQASATPATASTGGAVGTAAVSARPLAAPSAPTRSPSPGRSASPGRSPSPAGGTGIAAATAAVRRAQAQLTADQQALDAILTDASLKDVLALDGRSGACAAGPSTTSLTALTDATGTLTVATTQQADITAGSATVGTPTQSGSGWTYTITGTPSTGYPITITEQVVDASSCGAAIQKLVADVDPSPHGSAWSLARAVTGDELRLQAAVTTLEKLAAEVGTSGAHPSTSPSTPPARARTAGAAPGGSGTVTPQQIAADQAAVDSASAQVAVARQNLGEATITSPIGGTVEKIGLSPGSAAGGNAVTVVGPGAHEVSTTVPLTDIDLVKVGDPATVDVDGVAAPLTGSVSTIGVLGSTSGSSTAYPVTVLLDPSSARLFDGAGAAVSIAVASVGHVLTVPSSAVHTLGRLSTVTVLSGGTTRVARVGVGVVGTDRTQITSGLTAGQQVVLAQLDAPLPSSTNPLAGLRGAGLGRGGNFRGGGAGGGARPGG